MVRIVFSIALSLALAGCATVPSNAPPYQRAAAPSAGEGNLYIYRVGAYPTLRTPAVVIDDARIFDPPEKAYTVVALAQGRHEFVINWAWDTGWPDLKFPIEIVAGQSHYIKISGSFEPTRRYVYGGFSYVAGSSAQELEPDVAEAEMQRCCKYIAPRRK